MNPSAVEQAKELLLWARVQNVPVRRVVVGAEHVELDLAEPVRPPPPPASGKHRPIEVVSDE